MLHFFRKIRRDLLANSQFYKYLKYGIGEIILVVLGILIALYINNWNEERIGAENTKILFQNVSDELVHNIKSIDRIINMNIRKDSFYFKVLNKKVEPSDYKTDLYLSSFPLYWNRTSLVDDDFKELVAKKRKLTVQQDSLFLELKDMYGKRKMNTDKDDEMQVTTQHNFRDKMMNEQPWWSDFNNRGTVAKVTDEMIQFWLNDPFYLNQLSELQFREYWHTLGMLWFRSKALDLHKKITEMQEIERETTLVKDVADFEHVKGVYKYKSYTYNIRGQKELKTNIFLSDSEVLKWVVYPYSNSHIIISGQEKGANFLCEIVAGKDGKVLGLIHYGDMMEVDGKRRMAKKIE